MLTIIKFVFITLLCLFIIFPIYAQNELLYQQAFQAHEKGKYAQSSKLAKQLLKGSIGLEKATIFYLLAENKMQDAFRLSDKQIISYLDSTIYYNPNHFRAHYFLGSFRLYENPELGLKHLQQALKLDSSALDLIYTFSSYYESINDYSNVIKYTTLGLKHIDRDTFTNSYALIFYYQKAEALYYDDELDKAILAFNSVIFLDTVDYIYTDQARYNRGVCYNELEQYDNAFDDLNRVALRLKNQALKKDDFLTYHLALSYQFKTNPDLEQALYYINLSISVTQKKPRSTIEDLNFGYETRGAILLELNQFSKALDDFLKLQENENQAYWLGISYLALNSPQKALHYLLNHLEYFPDGVDALVATATCYHQLKQPIKACQYIHETMEYYNEDALEDADALQNLSLLQKKYCK